MLQTIRERVQGWIAGVIISLIILSFALWGIHSYFIGSTGDTVVAVVNGVDITKEQLSLAYERLRRQIQTQRGEPLASNEDIALRDTALRSLIDIQALRQASLNQGFQASNQQIDRYLQSMPEFQVNGQFSIERFQEILSTTRLSTNDVIDLVRTSLLIDQPRLGIMMTSFALPDEVAYTVALVNQERDIAYLSVPSTWFLAKPITIPEDKIKAYYDEHADEFRTPEQVTVEYVQLSPQNLQASIQPSDTDLKHFYDENSNAFNTPKTQSFDSVKEKVKQTYVRQHAEEKFVEMRDRLADVTFEHPESLELAAKTLGLPIKTSDFFTRDKAGKDISQYKKVRDVSFSNDVLNLKNNSDVIQLNSETVIVLRIKSHMASSLLPLRDVATKISNILKSREADNQAKIFSQNVLQKMQHGEQAEAVIKGYPFKWHPAAYMGRYSTKVDSAILETAFRLPDPILQNQKVVYGLSKLPDGYAIVAVQAVKKGVSADAKEALVFDEQVQNSLGQLEYAFYKQSQLSQSHIKVKT